MAFIKFNKSELVNLAYSLKREILSANKSGSYCNTSILTCNTRRYHGLLAVTLANLTVLAKQMLIHCLDLCMTAWTGSCTIEPSKLASVIIILG